MSAATMIMMSRAKIWTEFRLEQRNDQLPAPEAFLAAEGEPFLTGRQRDSER
jgi:hypothetical protein